MILLKYVKRKIRKIVNGFTECQNWNKFILRESFVAFLLLWYSLLCLTKHIRFLTKYKSQQQLKTKSYSWISTWDVLPFKIFWLAVINQKSLFILNEIIITFSHKFTDKNGLKQWITFSNILDNIGPYTILRNVFIKHRWSLDIKTFKVIATIKYIYLTTKNYLQRHMLLIQPDMSILYGSSLG